MTAAELRTWLMKQPRPSTLRLTTGKDVRTIPIANGVPWSQVASSTLALEPDLIEALDSAGATMRATRPDTIDDDAAPAAPAAVPPPAVSSDPETARFELVARLLSEAYRHSTDVAFNKMLELVTAISNRSENVARTLEATERALMRQQQDNIELQADLAAKDAENPLGDMVGALVQGASAAASHVSSKANGKANGKA